MKKNKLLIRLLVRLTKKYKTYDIFSNILTQNQINDYFENVIKHKPIACYTNSIIEDLMHITRKFYTLNALPAIYRDFNQILYKIFYENIKQFLVEKNCYEQFVYNIAYCKYSKTFNSFDEYYNDFKSKDIDIRKLILYSFHFELTKEGKNFWYNINDEYIEYIIKLLIK